MKEFMLLIRNGIDHQATWSPEQHQQFLKKCEDYIGLLKKEGKLISAQPLVREGRLISGSKGAWKDRPFNETKEVIVGYYHVLAEDLNDAMAIAKGNPEFEYGTTARIEVRPIKMKEEDTDFVYPKTPK
ncbi:MAG: YciI family protein [Thermodesulfobacteriota bacterium]